MQKLPPSRGEDPSDEGREAPLAITKEGFPFLPRDPKQREQKSNQKPLSLVPLLLATSNGQRQLPLKARNSEKASCHKGGLCQALFRALSFEDSELTDIKNHMLKNPRGKGRSGKRGIGMSCGKKSPGSLIDKDTHLGFASRHALIPWEMLSSMWVSACLVQGSELAIKHYQLAVCMAQQNSFLGAQKLPF